MNRMRLAAFGVLLGSAVAGCGGGDSAVELVDPQPPPGALPPPTAAMWHGRFVGSVTIDAQERFADAVLTEDGEIRIHVGLPGGGASGVIPSTAEEGFLQFTGEFAVQQEFVTGDGTIHGEGCADPGNGRFCEEQGPVEIELQFEPGKATTALVGELRVATPGGIETWPVTLADWSNYYILRARQDGLAGSWTELLAEFSSGGETIVTIDDLGLLFFQASETGCTGNGTVTPHADGAFNVYDVALTIASCEANYSYLNGEYEGLATPSTSDYWNYDSALRTWLTKKAGATSPAALTTWAPYIY